MTRRTWARMSVMLASLCACDRAADAPVTSVVRDSAGTEIVESTAAAWTDVTAWRISAEPVLRLGSVDGRDSTVLFSRIGGATRLPGGTIVVLEQQSNEIRWFDATGRHVITRGGDGRGPGEFNAAIALARTAGDTLVVQDAPRIRHVLYSPDGELVREELLDMRLYRELGRWVECMNLMLPDRSLLGCQPEPGLPARGSGTPGHLRTFTRYVRVPWTLDAAYPLGLYGGIEQWGVEVGGRLHYAVHPFHSRTAVAAGGDPLRVAIAVNPTYSIELWRPDGALERIVRRTGARLAATAEDREQAHDVLRTYAFGDEAVFNRFVAEIEAPDSLPAIVRLTIGQQGDLWVTRHNAAPRTEPTRIDVFDAEGRFLGELMFPPRFLIFEVGADYILGVRYDENDVPFVELYALDRAGVQPTE